MKRIVIAGRGHIGSYMARELQDDGYEVMSYDLIDGYNLTDDDKVRLALVGADAIIDTLPYQLNRLIAKVAAEYGIAYFNLTEDVKNTEYIRNLTSTAPLVPQCGLAPGMVSIIAQELTRSFRQVDTITIRVGALPQQKTNHLGYALTWNPAGLINEYCNPCTIVKNWNLMDVPALDGHETLMIDGAPFEAAYTSGGIGTLAETWAKNAREVNYKTLRFPGHFDFMRVLRDDLRLSEFKGTAEQWFTSALPRTTEDMVVIAIQVTGTRPNTSAFQQYTRTYAQTIYSADDATAIQMTTAHGALAVVDAYLRGDFNAAGFVRQEDLPYDAIRNSSYSMIYGLP